MVPPLLPPPPRPPEKRPLGKGVFVDKPKDLEMRSSCGTELGPKPGNNYTYKRQ